jgi:replication factor C subunit 3/5
MAEKQLLWCDKYRPKQLKDLEINDELRDDLIKLVERGDFPHLLVYGPPGSGKKTRVLALLRAIYGSGSTKLRVEHKSWKVKSKKIDITTVASPFHIELNPSDAGMFSKKKKIQILAGKKNNQKKKNQSDLIALFLLLLS